MEFGQPYYLFLLLVIPLLILWYFYIGDKKEATIRYSNLNLIPKDEYETLTVINGDVISDIDLNAFNAFHKDKQNDVTVTVAKYEHQVPFGVVDFNKNNDFNSLDEKPLLTHFVLSGIYCLNKNVCSLINKEKIDMTSIISMAKKLNKKIGIFPIHEYWKDLGSPDDFELVSKNENEK